MAVAASLDAGASGVRSTIPARVYVGAAQGVRWVWKVTAPTADVAASRERRAVENRAPGCVAGRAARIGGGRVLGLHERVRPGDRVAGVGPLPGNGDVAASALARVRTGFEVPRWGLWCWSTLRVRRRRPSGPVVGVTGERERSHAHEPEQPRALAGAAALERGRGGRAPRVPLGHPASLCVRVHLCSGLRGPGRPGRPWPWSRG